MHSPGIQHLASVSHWFSVRPEGYGPWKGRQPGILADVKTSTWSEGFLGIGNCRRVQIVVKQQCASRRQRPPESRKAAKQFKEVVLFGVF